VKKRVLIIAVIIIAICGVYFYGYITGEHIASVGELFVGSDYLIIGDRVTLPVFIAHGACVITRYEIEKEEGNVYIRAYKKCFGEVKEAEWPTIELDETVERIYLKGKTDKDIKLILEN